MTKDLESRLLAHAENEAGQNKDDFVRGGKCIIGLFWHDAEEEPEPGREIIIRNKNGIKVYPNPMNTQTAWPFS